jgi:hypothetical protein
VPLEQRKAEYNRIKAKINDNSPLKVGGSTSPEAVGGFLSWAKDNLPEGEARRIFALTQTYAKTALETGLEQRSRGMNTLAKVNYDTFGARPAPSAGAQAAAQSRAAAQGRRIMESLTQHQRATGVALRTQ